MSTRPKPRFWRTCRIYFRRFRIAIWLILLFLLGGMIYLNQEGLPDFIKRPLLQKLRARGLDLQFSRLRLRWYQGIVAENARFGQTDEALSPSLTVAEVQVHLDARALARFQLQVDSLVLRQGRFVWPIAQTNQANRELAVENIQTILRFLPDDRWVLDHFTARFAGASFQLSGVVTNASAVRDWKLFQPGATRPAPAPAGLWQRRLRELDDTLERIHFSAAPELRLDIRGDARDLQSFSALLHVAAPGADTPWGSVSEGRFTAHLFPANTNAVSRAALELVARNAQTRWAGITNFHLNIGLTTVEGQTNQVSGKLILSASQVQTEWAGAASALLTAQWVHAFTNPIPLSGHGQFQCDSAQTKWGRTGPIRFAADFACPSAPASLPASAGGGVTPSEMPALPDASWAWWTNLQPYRLDWQGNVASLQSPKLDADEIRCAGNWLAPYLAITNLEATLYQGRLSARAGLDVATRALQAQVASDFDPRKIVPLLTEGGRRWLEPYAWDQAPRLQADLALVLPAWTNRQPDWRAEVQPTLRLRGEFDFRHGAAYRGVRADAVHSHFIYSNQCWHLPDLTVTWPDGRLEAEHRANDRTKDFSWRLASTADLRLIRPLLEPNTQRVFDLFNFTRPPIIEAELHGRFHERERLGLSARVAATNFAFRGQSVAGLQTSLTYTNHVLQCFSPAVQRDSAQRASADGLTADFDAQLTFLTNAFSTADPMFIARVIGPHIVRAIERYQFLQPPIARVHGVIPMRGEEGADLHFDLDGGPFHWWKLNSDHIAGHVHWAGQQVTLTNIQADFYGGRAGGNAQFDFKPKAGADFQFTVAATNAMLQALLADLSTQTNHVEGRLNGDLIVTRANTEDWQSVDGYGDAILRDGLIWDIPLLSILTPVLDTLVPGVNLAHSRATSAACTFIITNGVVRSDDLEIHSAALRLQYKGTVDLGGRVNARVEAEPLRDVWLVGPLVTTALWPVSKMFETKVTGTLSQPRTGSLTPIPTLIQFPFHPLRTLKGLLPEDSGLPRTNTLVSPKQVGP